MSRESDFEARVEQTLAALDALSKNLPPVRAEREHTKERAALLASMQRVSDAFLELGFVVARRLNLGEPSDGFEALRCLAEAHREAIAEASPLEAAGGAAELAAASEATPVPERPAREEADFREREPSADGNRRQHLRYAVELDVTLSSEHNFFQGFSENISAGGVFIATHHVKPIGERMEIVLNLPDGAEPVRVIGEVRWVRHYAEASNTPPGIGLRFVDLAPGDEARIAEFLKDREPLFYDD
jgi:uncharacterized protein (TIGR02266 family)